MAMGRASYTITLVAALAGTAATANAQDIAAGHAFAREVFASSAYAISIDPGPSYAS
jgi:hypothetical protein